MFRFDFDLPSHSKSHEQDCLTTGDEIADLVWLPSKEILPSDTDLDKFERNGFDVDVFQLALPLRYVKPSSILLSIKDNELQCDENILLADQKHSDLIPSKYEGGLKIWEGTHDLANFLDAYHMSGLSVLDLGCGIGLLGIMALKKGADTVYFQDYNADVLQYGTIPSVRLNADSEQMAKCKFFSGDWESFAALDHVTFDYLLTSETIYNPVNYRKLLNTIKKVLKPKGVALLAAKSYYFGVGGSTQEFMKVVAEMGVFEVHQVWRCSEGVQREILKLVHKTT